MESQYCVYIKHYKLKLKTGEVIVVKTKDVIKLLGTTQPTYSKRKNEKKLTFQQLETIANHYGAELKDVYRFLGYDL